MCGKSYTAILCSQRGFKSIYEHMLAFFVVSAVYEDHHYRSKHGTEYRWHTIVRKISDFQRQHQQRGKYVYNIQDHSNDTIRNKLFWCAFFKALQTAPNFKGIHSHRDHSNGHHDANGLKVQKKMQ